jgi:hypothetical protein
MNNRQQSGRRRGRGGQRPQGGPGRPEQGNRIDNRARGNASQLLEKYKTLARDAQMQGDRVMTEYYLQFADHYFRVLSESRARFEENNPNANANRRPYQDDDFDGDEPREGAEGNEAEQGEDERRERMTRDRDGRDREGRENREPRERAPRAEREPREPRERRPRQDAAPVAEPENEAPYAEARPVRGGLRPRRNGAVNGHDHAESTGIEADRLPPSFAPRAEEPEAAAAEPEAEAAPAPKRRGRPRKVVEAPAEG